MPARAIDAERLAERWAARLDLTGPPPAHRPDLGPCGRWPDTSLDDNGYGIWRIGGRNVRVHRWAYETFVGPLLPGMEPDHLCHHPDYCQAGNACPHRACSLPWHLEAVTRRENVARSGAPPGINARKTHCDHGHEFTPGNIYVRPSRPTERECLTCKRENAAKLARRQREIARHLARTAGGTGWQLSILGD